MARPGGPPTGSCRDWSRRRRRRPDPARPRPPSRPRPAPVPPPPVSLGVRAPRLETRARPDSSCSAPSPDYFPARRIRAVNPGGCGRLNSTESDSGNYLPFIPQGRTEHLLYAYSCEFWAGGGGVGASSPVSKSPLFTPFYRQGNRGSVRKATGLEPPGVTEAAFRPGE